MKRPLGDQTGLKSLAGSRDQLINAVARYLVYMTAK
jgi:hypothetical protein